MLTRFSLRSMLVLGAILSCDTVSALTITVERDAAEITVRDVTPGGRIALLSVARIPRGHYSEVKRQGIVLEDDDSDGRVAWALDTPVALKSVWCAVDLSSGAYTIAAPALFRLATYPLSAAAFVWNAAAGHDEMHLDRATVDVLVVRPQVGVWTGRVSDGGAGDLDGRNDGIARTRPDQLRGLHGSGPSALRHLQRGDVVLVVDIDELEVFGTSFGPEVRP